VVGGGFDKNLSYFTGHYVGPLLLWLSRKFSVALVGVVCNDRRLFYRAVYIRKIMA